MPDCAMCRVGPEIFVSRACVIVLAPTNDGMRESPLCRKHLDEWHRWLLVIYGRQPETLSEKRT
jgi:hypothetical protein